MSLSPVELRHVELGRRPLGYDRKAVERLLADAASSFEDVWRDREDLRDEVHRLQQETERLREHELLLRNTLVSAERAADELRQRARKEAELTVEEARQTAREVLSAAENERERIRTETRRLRALEAAMRADYRAFLLSALDRLEVSPAETEAA
jgi:cell division initiation protein